MHPTPPQATEPSPIESPTRAAALTELDWNIYTDVTDRKLPIHPIGHVIQTIGADLEESEDLYRISDFGALAPVTRA